MKQAPQVKDLLLDNGLRIHLIADPGAREAAALLQVAAGSDHEPQSWPGLAHLLEHMLFTGSSGYSGDQRLMSWAPAHGGRLNATTRSDRTACFFAAPPAIFAEGVARLLDMLANPLFELAAVVQETAVIDAEYQLLCRDTDTLLEAALRQQFSGAQGLTRFCVGSCQAFGNDPAALQQALRAFHHQHWHAGSMTLWIQAPLPLAWLEVLVQQQAQHLPAAKPSVTPTITRLTSRGDQALQLPGAARLCITFALNDWQCDDSAWLNLFSRQLRDEAPGGLMAQLRARGWVDEVHFSELWRSSHAALFSVQWVLCQADMSICSGIMALFDQWLSQLTTLTSARLAHWTQLFRREFWQLSPLDQLCGRASGQVVLTPPAPGAWKQGITRLKDSARATLYVHDSVQGEEQRHQGFALRLAPLSTGAVWQEEAVNFTLWPRSCRSALPPLPATYRSLLHWRPGGEARLLLLSTPGESEAAMLQTALRPLAAELAHQQGEWRNGRYQGHWLMQLRAEPEVLESAVVGLCARLETLSAVELAEGAQTVQRAIRQQECAIPVHRLLAALTRALTLADSTTRRGGCHSGWQAVLAGGGDTLHRRLAQRLSALLGDNQSAMPEALALRTFTNLTLARGEGDAALLLFCPLPRRDRDARLMWRLLALFCQPRFFQQLRVEKNLGYVVSCRFHQWGNEEGILFALQSPHTSAEELWQHLLTFLHGLPAAVTALSASGMADLTQALWRALQRQGQDLVWQVCERCFTPGMSLTATENSVWLQSLGTDDLLSWLPLLQQAAEKGWQGRVA